MVTQNQYEDLFHQRGSSNLYHQSLITHLGEMLIHAEALYGPRDPRYILLGVHITDNSAGIYTVNDGAYKFIFIKLAEGNLRTHNDALFWTAHEVFHCLRPSGNMPPNRLEEGFACHFASQYMNDKLGVPMTDAGKANYNQAWDNVRQFIKEGGDLMAIGRANAKPFANLVAADLVGSINGNMALAQDLATSFVY